MPAAVQDVSARVVAESLSYESCHPRHAGKTALGIAQAAGRPEGVEALGCHRVLARLLFEVPVVGLDLLQAQHVKRVAAQPRVDGTVVRLDMPYGGQPARHIPRRYVHWRGRCVQMHPHQKWREF